MTVPTRIAALLAVSVLAAVGLTACDPGTPEPTPIKTATSSPTPKGTATPTPTPEAPVAARVQVDGTSITVLAADGTTIVDVPFTTEAATAATQLGAAIGIAAVVTTTSNDGNCAADTTHYGWGGLDLHSPGGFAMAPGATFVASVRAAATTNGLPVGMPSGQGVGTATSDVLAANPGVAAEGDPAGDSVVYFDVLSGHPLGDMDTFYGAEALANGGVITSLVSPVYYYYDC